MKVDPIIPKVFHPLPDDRLSFRLNLNVNGAYTKPKFKNLKSKIDEGKFPFSLRELERSVVNDSIIKRGH